MLSLLRTLLPVAAAIGIAACSAGGDGVSSPTPSPPAGGTATPAATPTTVPTTPVVDNGPAATAGPSGIEGTVLLGPMCPVLRADSPCPDRPFSATVVVWDGDRSREVTTLTSDENGRFRLELAPGEYYLDPQPPEPDRLLPRGSPETVTVRRGEFAAVTIRYDTGLR